MLHDKALALSRRFLALPAAQRRVFLGKLREQGLDISALPIPPQAVGADGPVSYAQQRLWFLEQLEPGNSAYHLPGALRLRGRLDEVALQRTLDALAERHASLRTTFTEGKDGVPRQRVRTAQPVAIERVELGEADEARLQAWALEFAQRPFDLREGPLWRVALIALGPVEQRLLLCLHHIIADGWSIPLLLGDFVQLYRAQAQSVAAELPALPVQYADYARWQRACLEAGAGERELAYWRTRLEGDQSMLELPADRPRPAVQSHRGARLHFALDANLAERLRGLARARGVTLFMLLLAAYKVLLYRLSGQGELRIGVPVAGRTRPETEGLIGLFVNTQVLRTELAGEQPFTAVLEAVKAAALGAQAHQELPFEHLVEALQPERSLSHNPLFQVLYNHQQREHETLALLPDLAAELLRLDSGSAQVDLALHTWEDTAGRLTGNWNYALDLFEPATIEGLHRCFLRLLTQLAAWPETAIGDLDWLDAEDRMRLAAWNATACNYGAPVPVHRLFERHAAGQPDAVALLFGEQSLTYAELDRRANRLANHLRRRGIGPESLVGVAALRSVEMVIALYAVLKAGAAYVPMDPEYPQERLRYMLEDAGVELLLTHASVLGALPQIAGLAVLDLDALDLSIEPETAPELNIHPEQLAYLIYTSGSTGRPKGAGNTHAALFNRLQWMQTAYRLDGTDTVLQKTPFSFDVSVWEFFWPLMSGARLALAPPGDHRDPARLVRLIREQRVTTLHFVPSMLAAFSAHDDLAGCESLKRILCSGEALSAELQRETLRRLPQASLYNLYGPTEAAIDVSHWRCADVGGRRVPIGRPIANLHIHILDARLNPQPPGAPGELYIGGTGLARGYHRRAGLTAERFVASPFGNGERLYRTGDLARWREDGVIEYLGRLDQQVKLRGLRVETGEIEAVLLEHPAVKEAVVLARAFAGGQQLVGYLMADGVDEGELRAHLKQRLPDYMVPAHILYLERFPLTPSGKLDRKALPTPQPLGREYVAPQAGVEAQLAQLWQELLGVERVGRHDNFFELGGDSILSLQIIARARRLSIQLAPRQLFERQTIAELAQVAGRGDTPVAASVDIDHELPLTPIQAWFFDQPIARRAHWNQSVLLIPTEPLDRARLARALEAVLAQHDALRLCFRQDPAGRWSQRYRAVESAERVLWTHDAVALPALLERCDRTQASLALAGGPLLRALHVRLAEGDERLLLVAHHLVMDGVSWRILLEDLQRAYAQLAVGDAVDLGAKSASFQQWAERLRDYADSETLAAERDYWVGLPRPTPLPCDNPAGANRMQDARRLSLRLDPQRTCALLGEALPAYRAQINDLLLAALVRALHRWSGCQQALIALEGHGREDLFAGLDLSRTVGWFTSLYPVCLEAHDDPGETLKATKERLRRVPHGGLGYGLLKHLRGETDLPELTHALVFNYLGRLDSEPGGLFALSDEPAGAQRDAQAPLTGELTLDGQVTNGCLSLTCSYSSVRHCEARIQALLDALEVALDELIEHCRRYNGVTPSDFPLAGLTQAQLDALPLPAREIEDIYPLTPMQQGLLFHSELDAGEDLYVNQVSLALEGLPPERFRAAWAAALRRHPVLRSAFLRSHDSQTPLQLVRRDVPLTLRELDWRGREDQAADLAELCRSERETPFDLAAPPLMRLVLVRLAAGRWQLVWTLHHILLDGWSSANLLSEVLQVTQGDAPLPAVGRYRDYLGWLAAQDAERSAAFWREYLQSFDEPTLLSQALHGNGNGNGNGEARGRATRVQALDHAALDAGARRRRVTRNTLIQAAWILLLQRYTGQCRVAFGATVAGRPATVPGIERLLGLFINTLPVVQAPDPARRVQDWLAELQAQNLALREHEHTPLFEIQRLGGHAGRELFDTLLVFENYPVDAALREQAASGLRFGAVEVNERTHYPLSLAVVAGERLELHVHYRREHFSERQIERLCGHFQQLLASVSESPDARLGELPLLSAAEWKQLRVWNQPTRPPLDPRPIHAMIAAQAQQRPEAIAVVHGKARLSFGELEVRANRLAHRLICLGVGAEVRVGVALERGPEMLLALYAVLKAGGAYVPLDPDYPQERLRYVLEDAGVGRLLSHEAALGRLPQMAGVEVLNLDALDLAGEPDTAPEMSIHPEQLAYLIYTSGSTGRPKGVAVPHGAIAMHCQCIGARYELTPADRELHFLSISFDGAHERWLTPLACGARVVLRDQALWSVQETYDCLLREGITVAAFPPSYLRQLADWAGQLRRPPGVKTYCFAGEAFSREDLRQVIDSLQPAWIINGYGPTETVITPTLWRVAAAEADFDSACAPIGNLVGERQGYVLDEELNPLPVGVAGELYLGGALARGYLDRPGPTAERFVPNPFRAGERLYRTGDRVRLGEDGLLEYLGRSDQQVKLRGFRIEIGEIEAALKACAGVREAVVVLCERAQGGRLVGYISGSDKLSESDLKTMLRARLPEYMVPAHLVVLDRLPQQPSGKLDRSALPAPAFTTIEYQAPRTPQERRLAELWQTLLGVDQIGRSDHFFELGGHSLLATQLISRLRHDWGLDLPLRALFEAPRLADFAERLAGVGRSPDRPRLRRRQEAGPVLQSFAQQRLWFLAQLDPESTAYNLPGLLRLSGVLDCDALQQAFDSLAARHQVLRTLFGPGGEGGVPLQHIQPPGPVPIEHFDVAAAADAEAECRAFFQAFIARPFDLECDPPWRLALVSLGEREHRLLLCMHHIISDGWSVRVLLEEFVHCYRAAALGQSTALAALPIQYADYARWQRDHLALGERARQLAWWRAELGEGQPLLELPTDRPRPALRGGKGAQHGFVLAPALVQRLRELAQARGVTLFMLLLAVYQTLLYRLSGQQDLRIAVPVAGRQRPETEGLIGLFVNTLVVRGQVAGDQTVDRRLAQVRESVLAAQAHQDLPFEQLVEALAPERSLSYNPLVQVAYNHQQRDHRVLTTLPELRCEVLDCAGGGAQFDLALNTLECDDGRVLGAFDYATDLFESSTVARFCGHFQQLLDSVCARPDARLGELILLSAAEQDVLMRWSRPALPPLDPRPIHALIAAQAQRQPQAIALVHGDERLSFAEFEARANRLAHRLIRLGVGPEVRVGVALERGCELLVALYAVLKAGGAYLPLDPDYPAERLRYVLEDASVGLLLSHAAALARLPEVAGLEVLDLDRLDLTAEPEAAPEVAIHSEQLAYLIHTSGSTGRPKGVAVAHGALSLHCQRIGARYGLTPADRELHFLSISFDGAHERWLTPLAFGTRVVLRDQALWSVQETYDCLRREDITVAAFPPSYLRELADWAALQGRAPGVQTYCLAGEAFSRETLQQIVRALEPAWIINGYGPTETVVTPTLWQVAAQEADFTSAYAPIGDLVGERQGYVLDDELNMLPIGVVGELYLGGALARGYLGRPGATAERFVPNPFRSGERLYRTGDRVRLRDDGLLEYFGRRDQQVKLRGFRIEIGEIEAALKACTGVREALVRLREGAQGKQLVGYISGESLDEHALKNVLKAQLPEYMVPAHFVILTQFPQLPNGKLDRNALPAPQFAAADYQLPQTPQEALLAKIWQALLGVERVSRHDNFFELGGDSILSLSLITRVRRAGWQLTPRDTFRHQRLAELAAVMQPLMENTAEQEAATGEVPLTPIQAHFFAQPLARPEHWNQALLLEVRRPLDATLLKQTMEALLAQHDSLRLGFQRTVSGRWRQRYCRAAAADELLWVRRVSGREALEELCEAAQRSLALERGPLLRLLLAELPDGGQRLLLVAHHLVVDGVSWRLLLEDLERAYDQLAADQPVELGAKSNSYQRWARHLVQYAGSASLGAELEYWAAVADERVQPLPVDDPQGERNHRDLASCDIELDATRTRQLLRQTRAGHGAQLDGLLLAALAQALRCWAGLDELLIALEGHGREALFDELDISRTLGWFTSLYPVRLQARPELADTVAGVRRRLASIPNKGVGYGVLRYLADTASRERLAAARPPQIAFNYLGQFDQSLAASRFAPAAESPGALVDGAAPLTYELSINGQVLAGRLTLSCRYSRQRYRRETVERLMSTLEQVLAELLALVPAAVRPQAPAPAVPVPSGLNPLVRLNPPGPRLRLFCPHPVSGTAVGYYPLAARLASNWEVWGLQNRQLLDPRWQDQSLAQMARDYVRVILEAQPGGPYHLLGWSMGGALALEMAWLLERLGKRVAFIGLVDGYVPGAGLPRRPAAEEAEQLGTEEWRQLLAIERRMHGLARAHHKSRPLGAPVHAWWAARSPESNQGGQALLEQALGRPLAASHWLEVDHLGIIRDPVFMKGLADQLDWLREPSRLSGLEQRDYAES